MKNTQIERILSAYRLLQEVYTEIQHAPRFSPDRGAADDLKEVNSSLDNILQQYCE